MEDLLHNFFNLEVMGRYLPQVWAGFWLTVALALLVVLAGLSLGLGLAVLRAFQWRVLNWGIIFFVDLFRALPPIVVVIIFYFALPYVNVQMSGFVATWLTLSLVLAAFAEEIFWAGITAVDRGQWEAARSTGLSFFQALRDVVILQAIRMTIPPLTNRTIAITKGTAIGSVVAVQEILNQASSAQAQAANPSPLTLGAMAYLLLFLPVVIASRWIESRFSWKR